MFTISPTEEEQDIGPEPTTVFEATATKHRGPSRRQRAQEKSTRHTSDADPTIQTRGSSTSRFPQPTQPVTHQGAVVRGAQGRPAPHHPDGDRRQAEFGYLHNPAHMYRHPRHQNNFSE